MSYLWYHKLYYNFIDLASLQIAKFFHVICLMVNLTSANGRATHRNSKFKKC